MSGLSDSLDIWTIPLENPEIDVQTLRSWLSADELARLARFKFDHLQRDFAIAHGSLRRILSSYLGTTPEAVQFTFRQRQKPAIPGTPLEFNLTHSGRVAAVAVTDSTVGIDVERMRTMPDLMAVASRFFAPREAAEVQAAAENERVQLFFRIWTRKEAFVKCLGDGLYAPLDSFCVSSEGEARFLGFDDPAHEGRWQIQDFDPGAGYAGAVVYAGGPKHVRRYRFPQDLPV